MAGADLRSRLVAAAAAMMTAPPAPAVPSLRAVARACGVSQTAVYLYFSSQADLIDAVVSAQIEDAEAQIFGADHPEESPRSRFLAFAGAYAEWAVAHAGAYRLIFEDVRSPATDLVANRSDKIVGQLVGLTQALRPDDDEPDVHAQRVWAALHGLAILRGYKPGYAWRTTLSEEVDAIVSAFFPQSPAHVPPV